MTRKAVSRIISSESAELTESAKGSDLLTITLKNIEGLTPKGKVLKEFDITILSVRMNGNVLNISTTSGTIIMDINQEIDVELARLFLVLEELENLKMRSNSIDIRFERPAIQIDK